MPFAAPTKLNKDCPLDENCPPPIPRKWIMMNDDASIMETGLGALLTLQEFEKPVKRNQLVVKLSKINTNFFNYNDQTVNKERDGGNAHDNTPKREGFTNDNEDWSPMAISSLLDAWHDHSQNTNESSSMESESVWKEISEEVSGRCEKSKKPKDFEQCKLKLKAMQGRYNREKMAKKFNSNECSSNWEWYETMDTIFKRTPNFVINSMDDLKSKQGSIANSSMSNLALIYNVKEKHIGKKLEEENVTTKSPFVNVKEKYLEKNNNKIFDSKVFKGEELVNCDNLSSPTTPKSSKSPRNSMKVKWSDSTSPRFNLIDKFEDQICQDSASNAKPAYHQNAQRIFLLVNEIKDKLILGEQLTSNHIFTLDRKGKRTLIFFNSNFDNSIRCDESDTMDQNSTISTPIVMKSYEAKRMSNKSDDRSSSLINDDNQNLSKISVLALSRSINCNYKCTCVETIMNSENEIKEGIEYKTPRENESHTCTNSTRGNETTITNIRSGDDQMALSITRRDSHIEIEKKLPRRSPLASIIPQSKLSYNSSKQKFKRLRILSQRYKHERENRPTQTLISALMRVTNSVPRSKKTTTSPNRRSCMHEPNLVTTLMTFGAMIQQMERNHIVLIEKVLSEQSKVMNDFVKMLKYNQQVREATVMGLVVRFLSSIFLIGMILYGISKTTSSWIPFQSNSWNGKNNDEFFFQLAWIGCFIVVLGTQLLWTIFKARPSRPSTLSYP